MLFVLVVFIWENLFTGFFYRFMTQSLTNLELTLRDAPCYSHMVDQLSLMINHWISAHCSEVPLCYILTVFGCTSFYTSKQWFSYSVTHTHLLSPCLPRSPFSWLSGNPSACMSTPPQCQWCFSSGFRHPVNHVRAT